LAGVVAALPALPVEARAAPVRHALVVGANDGGGTLDPLRYAERDAEQFARVLTELGGFPETRVTVLYQPDRGTLQAALAHHAALAQAAEDDLFVFYYSGHADAQGLRLRGDTYWFESLKHDIRAIDATARLGILDACRSGAITRLKGAKVAPSLFGGQERLAVTGEAWMTATSADELAQESEDLRGGFFTHYLVSGMRGAADTDDGIVDVNELYRYTYGKVVARSGQAGALQRPLFDVNLAGAQGLPLTDVRQAHAAVVLPGSEPGHVTIHRLSDMTQMAELDVLPYQDVQLALPAGRYLLRRREGERLYEARANLVDGQPVQVRDWSLLTPELARARGADGVEAFEARVGHYRARSEAFVQDLKLDESPPIAGLASLLVPGAGQIYNGQYWKAGGYFLGTASLVGGATLFSLESDGATGPDRQLGHAAAALGFAIWGASVADAIYNVRRNEDRRPRTGGAVGWSTGFTTGGRTYTGLMAEITPVEHLSIGLDRTGWSRAPDGSWDVHLGSRLMGALEGERFRPGVFMSYGLRLGTPDPDAGLALRGVIGAGGMLRYHVTPRYAVEMDMRWERDGNKNVAVGGIGMTVHLGRGE